MATGNTSGKGDPNGNFTGTEILNTAFIDRFSIKMTMGYLPEDKEIGLLVRKGVDLKEAKCVVGLANLVRSAFVGGTLSITFSTRKLLDYALFRKSGVEAGEALGWALLNWLDADDLPVVDAMRKRVWDNQVPF